MAPRTLPRADAAQPKLGMIVSGNTACEDGERHFGLALAGYKSRPDGSNLKKGIR